MCYEKNDEERYVYYAGAFKEASEAESAYEQLKKMGFRKPEIVVWEDGLYRMIGEPNAESDGESAEERPKHFIGWRLPGKAKT